MNPPNTNPHGIPRPNRSAEFEETTILTPVPDGTGALDRIPISHRKRWIVLSAGLGVLLAGAIAMVVYLWDVSNKWEDQVLEVKAQNFDLGERLSAEQTTVVDQQRQIDLVTEQLTTAQKRILELADEANQRDDATEFYTQQINDLTVFLNLASSTANALEQCVESQDLLAQYKANAANYDAAELAQFERDVATLCDSAIAANTELQKGLTE